MPIKFQEMTMDRINRSLNDYIMLYVAIIGTLLLFIIMCLSQMICMESKVISLLADSKNLLQETLNQEMERHKRLCTRQSCREKLKDHECKSRDSNV